MAGEKQSFLGFLGEAAMLIVERMMAALIGVLWFPLKSLAVNVYALLLVLSTGLLAILALPIHEYHESKKNGHSTFVAITASIMAGIAGLLFLPIIQFVLLSTLASSILVDAVWQPLRGLYYGLFKGLDEVITQLVAVSDNENSNYPFYIAGSEMNGNNDHFSGYSIFLSVFWGKKLQILFSIALERIMHPAEPLAESQSVTDGLGEQSDDEEDELTEEEEEKSQPESNPAPVKSKSSKFPTVATPNHNPFSICKF